MTRGFISYSHRDFLLCKALREHLASIEHAYQIKFWSDNKISVGQKWSDEISSAIKNADIFIFLLTPSFFDSDYIMSMELPAICERFDFERHLSIPILARECYWDWQFGTFQAVPKDNKGILKAVDLWKPMNSGWNAVLQSTKSSIEQQFGFGPAQTTSWGKPK